MYKKIANFCITILTILVSVIPIVGIAIGLGMFLNGIHISSRYRDNEDYMNIIKGTIMILTSVISTIIAINCINTF